MKAGDFCWNELLTSDVEKAKTFYSALFGWEYQEHEMSQGTYTMIKKETNGGGGLLQIPKDKLGQVPSHWLSYVSVDNLENSVKKAVSLGAALKMPITEVGDFGQFAIITDPTGAYLALWQALKTC